MWRIFIRAALAAAASELLGYVTRRRKRKSGCGCGCGCSGHEA